MDDEKKNTYKNDLDALDEQTHEHSSTGSSGEGTRNIMTFSPIEEVERNLQSVRKTAAEFSLFCEKKEVVINTLFSKLTEKGRGHEEEVVNELKEEVRKYVRRCMFVNGKVCVLNEAVLHITKECIDGLEVDQKPVEDLTKELHKLIQMIEHKSTQHEDYSKQLNDHESKTANRFYIGMLNENISVVRQEIKEFRTYCDTQDLHIKSHLQEVLIQETESGFTEERLKKRDTALEMLKENWKSYFRACCGVKGKILILETLFEKAKASYIHSNTAECSEVVMKLEKILGWLKDLHRKKYEEFENNEKEIAQKESHKQTSLVVEIERLNKQLHSSCEHATHLQKQLKETEASCDEFAKTFDEEQLKVKQLEAKLIDQNNRLHEMEKKDTRIQELEDNNNKLSRTIKQLSGKLQAAQSTSCQLEQDLHTQTSKTYHLNLQFQNQILASHDCLRHLEESRKACRELEQEKNSLVLRLSKIAGDNLTYQNPNIADLGDPKRPTKLAEVYNELYDNEWTDAFDRLRDLTDTKKVQQMLSIMKSADDHCGGLYKQHTDAVRNGLTTLSINYKTKVKVDTDVQRGEDDKNKTTRQTIHPNTNTDATHEERDVLGNGANNDNEDTNDQTHPKGTERGNYESDQRKSVEKKAKDTTDEEMQERQMDGIEEYGNPKDGAVRKDGKSYEQDNQEQNSVRDARENPAPLTQHDGAVKGNGQSADNQSQNSGMNVHSNPDPLTQLIDYEENTEEIPFEFDDLNNTQKQAIADFARFVQNALEEKVVEVTSKVIVEEMELPKDSEILSYVRKCVTFCWSARLHDPPVYIDFMEVTEDTRLDLNVYKPYTKTGKLVDYVVWPPIYLHKGGPMLSKGVAQGKNKN